MSNTKSPKLRWLVTNGDLGTDANRIYYYSTHGNGKKALIRKIQEMADKTGEPSWAQVFPEYAGINDNPTKYYRKYPQEETK